jgi:propanediol utilization protein
MNRRSASCRECGLCDIVPAASAIGRPDLEQLVESVVRDVVSEVFSGQKTIPVGVSARHMHITQSDLETLFGPGYQLTKLRDLNQPGEFAANETVSVVGPKRRLFEKVRILGPVRNITQVELSYTDGVYLGLDLPYRLSGDIAGSAPLVLIGPHGVLNLSEGGIRAARHIHINPIDAERWGLKQGQKVSVQNRGPASTIFNEVIVRIGENLNLEMHIDTDEANAAGLRCGDPVILLNGNGRNHGGN